MHDTTNNMAERRRHPRTQLKMTLPCLRLDPDGGDVIDSLQTVDISKSGIGAYCERPYYPGQRILLNLPISKTRGRRSIYASVVRCKPDQDGYHIGLQFEASSAASSAAVPSSSQMAA